MAVPANPAMNALLGEFWETKYALLTLALSSVLLSPAHHATTPVGGAAHGNTVSVAPALVLHRRA
jgi:hypothetical protein